MHVERSPRRQSDSDICPANIPHHSEDASHLFQIWGKPVYIEAILNGGIIDSAPFIRAGNKKAINRDLSFIAYLKKEKHI